MGEDPREEERERKERTHVNVASRDGARVVFSRVLPRVSGSSSIMVGGGGPGRREVHQLDFAERTTLSRALGAQPGCRGEERERTCQVLSRLGRCY